MDKRTWSFLLSISAGLSGCAISSNLPTSNPITITILHTNDTHSHLEPFPRDSELTAGNQGPQQGGIARRKMLIDTIRSSDPNVLLLDAGDNFQGTIFYNAWRGSAEVMALNTLGYDAITLGNHEFDLGPVMLGRALRGEPVKIASSVYNTQKLQAPIIATNVDVTSESSLQGLLKRSVILERGGEQFGILGIVTQDTKTISSPGQNIRFLDYVTSVQKGVDHLKAAGVNKIILLSHFGYSVDLAQIPKLSGVDIVISGHDHALLGDPAIVEKIAPDYDTQVKGPYPTVVIAADGAPVLVVSAYEWGRWLGKLKVSFDESGVIEHWDGKPIFVQGCKFVRGEIDCSQQIALEDPEVKAQVATYRGPVDQLSSEIIGKSGMFFDGNRNRGVRTQEMPLGNLIADTLLAASFKSDHAVAAFINSGGIRAGLNAGDVTFENALEVLPFGNTLVVVELKGDELVAALDYGVSRPGEGAFPQVSGLKLVYCTSKLCPTALRLGGRVIALTVSNVPVDLTATYRIAINSFMANGGDGYTMLKDICARSGKYCRDTGVLKLDLLIDEFKTNSPVVRRVEDRILTRTFARN